MIALLEQILVNGLLAGFVYVLMALGFTLIFGIMRIVNFAHGELYMASGFVTLVLYGSFGLNYFLAVVLAIAFAAVLGAFLELVVFRRFVGLELNGMIASLAVAVILQSIALIVFGPTEHTVERPVSGVWQLDQAIVSLDRAAVSACSIVILLIFYAFLKYTRVGLAMQAVAQDRETASLMGVRARQIHLIAFAVGSALAGAAGALMAPVYVIGPYMGELPLLKAFVVVVLGGLGSIPGALLGGLLIGVIESMFATFFDSTIALISSFMIVLLIIIARPTGLLGRVA